MQAMSTEQQAHYQNSTGSHQPTPTYFIPNEHVMRNPNGYGQPGRMQTPYYATQLPGSYMHPSVYYQTYSAPPMMPTNGPRGTPVHIVRPPNEVPNIGSVYIPQGAYPSYPAIPNSLSTASNPYTAQPYNPYSPGPANHIVNPQVPFSGSNNPRQTPTSAQNDQQQASSSQPTQTSGKREKKPLLIVNPVSMETVEVTTSTATSTALTHLNADDQCPGDSTAELTSATKKSIKNTDTTQKQTAFRHDFARLLADSHSQTEKTISASPTEDVLPKEELTDIVTSPSDSTYPPTSTNVNRELNPTKLWDQPQSIHPVMHPSEKQSDSPISHDDNKTEPLKIDLNDPTKTTVINSNISSDDTPIRLNDGNADVPLPEDPLSPSSSDGNFTDQSPSSRKSSKSDASVVPDPLESEPKPIGETSSISKRASYTIQQLLKKRTDPNALIRPNNLKHIEGVTKPLQYGREPSAPARGSICLEKPAFENRVANPYVPADRNRMDANDKFIRDVTSILNKLTPQTYDKLAQDLDGLELNSDQRLDGMIRIIFSKAVDEPAFCSLYAKLCQHFQRKQVTVPNADGEMVKYFFRQFLLTRCQKEFENDYRQEIEYEKRQKDVEEIKDDKIRKDAAEKLEEDLHKAKRKKLGNIFFIGELFKVQMLTAPIMYECVEYLLRDKTDEESLECLCRLLRTIGKELDAARAGEKTPNRVNLEKHYRELEGITTQRTASSRIRFMIQDLMEQRKAAWVARRAEVKPLTIDEIHEQERIKRDEQEREQERDRQQRREFHRGSHSQQQYGESRGSRGSRGSGMKQQSNRTDDDRGEHRFDVNAVRKLQSNDKINQGTMSLNLAPSRPWSKGSGVDKKTEENRSSAARKPPPMPAQNSKSKTPYPGNPGYAVQRQPSRELARGSSQRDRENTIDPLRKTTNGPSGITSPNGISSANSPDSSRNASREQSRNASRDSSMSERKSNVNTTAASNMKLTSSLSNDSTTMNKTDASNATFDEEKTQARVHALIEEYIENYSDTTERPVNEAIEDVSDFCTSNVDHQAIIVRELFSNVFEAKQRARKAVGHLLDVAIHKDILSEQGMLEGFKLIVELAPDFAVDIPLIWQYVAEIIGAFISAPSSNISLIKPILQSLPDDKSKQFFQSVIRSATEFSSKSRIQQVWSSSGLSFDDLFRSDLIDSSFNDEYDWLSEADASKDKLSPCADTKLVKLFKSVNDPGSVVTGEEIIKYIHQNMNATDKFYIRNIVLSYLQACLISRESQKKIQEDIARSRITILNTIIEHKPEAEIQAVYAIQNFVHKLEHPYKMAQLLFDMFYDEECVSEDAFFYWLKTPDQSETEGHSVVEMSTKDFFVWLQQAEEEES